MNISTIHPRVWISHPEDIYRHFILDDAVETATFLIAKNQAQVNAFEICR